MHCNKYCRPSLDSVLLKIHACNQGLLIMGKDGGFLTGSLAWNQIQNIITKAPNPNHWTAKKHQPRLRPQGQTGKSLLLVPCQLYGVWWVPSCNNPQLDDLCLLGAKWEGGFLSQSLCLGLVLFYLARLLLGHSPSSFLLPTLPSFLVLFCCILLVFYCSSVTALLGSGTDLFGGEAVPVCLPPPLWRLP